MLAHTNIPFRGQSEIWESRKLQSKPFFYYFSLGAPVETTAGKPAIVQRTRLFWFSPSFWGEFLRCSLIHTIQQKDIYIFQSIKNQNYEDTSWKQAWTSFKTQQ